jgi:hypothetical protein
MTIIQPDNFVFFLPQSRNPAKPGAFIVTERNNGDQAVCSSVGSLVRADSVIRQILETTKQPVIIDTYFDAGRDLLFRLVPVIEESDRVEKRLFLTSIESVYDISSEGEIEIQSVVSAFLQRSAVAGGARPVLCDDVTAVKVYKAGDQKYLMDGNAVQMFRHPLIAVPKMLTDIAFILQKMNFDTEEKRKAINAAFSFVFNICCFEQSPFPYKEGRLLRLPEEENIDDVIFTALSGSTQNRKSIKKKYPKQCKVIISAHHLTRVLNLSMMPVFKRRYRLCDKLMARALIDLTYSVWRQSFNIKSDYRQNIVNTDMLEDNYKNQFENVL